MEIGVKAGIAGLAGSAIKDMADKMTSDELDHLVTLEMMGNDEITSKYLISLHNKYSPSHAGNNNGQADVGPSHTGNNDVQVDVGPNHTGNNHASGQEATNTGNTEGAPNTGGNTTITPIPDGPGKDDLAYLALKGKEAQEAAGKLGFDRRIPAQKAPFNSHGQPVFYDGKNYITPDIDSHNVTNGWKMFDRKGNRIGTYDSDLNRIKD
uniref:toxin C-terminal domain-containing protein n=1 Tax=Leclercia sp. EC_58 TaxID=2584090 RepID=UPI0035CA3D88